MSQYVCIHHVVVLSLAFLYHLAYVVGDISTQNLARQRTSQCTGSEWRNRHWNVFGIVYDSAAMLRKLWLSNRYQCHRYKSYPNAYSQSRREPPSKTRYVKLFRWTVYSIRLAQIHLLVVTEILYCESARVKISTPS